MGNEDIDTVIQTNRHIGREIMEGDRDSEQTDRLTERRWRETEIVNKQTDLQR